MGPLMLFLISLTENPFIFPPLNLSASYAGPVLYWMNGPGPSLYPDSHPSVLLHYHLLLAPMGQDGQHPAPRAKRNPPLTLTLKRSPLLPVVATSSQSPDPPTLQATPPFPGPVLPEGDCDPDLYAVTYSLPFSIALSSANRFRRCLQITWFSFACSKHLCQ